MGTEGIPCGRIKDIYFEDNSWNVTHLLLSIEPRQFGQKQVLVAPERVHWALEGETIITLDHTSAEIESLPLASSVLPVCKQYASLALASPGALLHARGMVGSNPHLRSARAVMNYKINADGDFGGTLADLIIDGDAWQVRYLAVEQILQRQKLRFHILPQSVERFTWATQSVFLRELQPVRLDGSKHQFDAIEAA